MSSELSAALELAERPEAPPGMKVLADEVRGLQGKLRAAGDNLEALNAYGVRVVASLVGGERLLAVPFEQVPAEMQDAAEVFEGALEMLEIERLS